MTALPEATLDAIAAIYDAAVDEAGWTVALERFGDLLGRVPTIAVFESAGSGGPAFHCVRQFTDGEAAYAEHYRLKDPIRPYVLSAPAGVYTDRMIVEKNDLMKTEFYNDYARPQGMHGVIQAFAVRDGDVSGMIGATCPASRGDFDQHDVNQVAVLVRHFARAMRLQLRLRAAEVTADSTVEALHRLPNAVFLVAASGAIVLANRAAEAIIAARDGLTADATGLRAATAGQTTALRRLIAGSADRRSGSTGGAILLPRPSGRRPLSLSVVPLGIGPRPAWLPSAAPAAMVTVTDPEAGTPSPDRLRELFALTPAEAQLAVHIAAGGGVKAAARALGVAPSTARSHLHRVFAKTGTGRQAELAALLATSTDALAR